MTIFNSFLIFLILFTTQASVLLLSVSGKILFLSLSLSHLFYLSPPHTHTYFFFSLSFSLSRTHSHSASSFSLFQYNQAPRMAKFALANLAFRIGLNKFLPFIFSPPAFWMVVNQPELNFQQVIQINLSRVTYLSFSKYFYIFLNAFDGFLLSFQYELFKYYFIKTYDNHSF